jgi:CxxC-x17-CxxC domain-containing protein
VIIGNLIFFNYASQLPEVIITTQKTMFEIKCSDCGKTAIVPFKPTAGKQAYCKTCLSKHRFTQSESVSKTDRFDPKQAWARRRESMQVNKAADQSAVFQWSYSIDDKKAV